MSVARPILWIKLGVLAQHFIDTAPKPVTESGPDPRIPQIQAVLNKMKSNRYYKATCNMMDAYFNHKFIRGSKATERWAAWSSYRVNTAILFGAGDIAPFFNQFQYSTTISRSEKVFAPIEDLLTFFEYYATFTKRTGNIDAHAWYDDGVNGGTRTFPHIGPTLREKLVPYFTPDELITATMEGWIKASDPE